LPFGYAVRNCKQGIRGINGDASGAPPSSPLIANPASSNYPVVESSQVVEGFALGIPSLCTLHRKHRTTPTTNLSIPQTSQTLFSVRSPTGRLTTGVSGRPSCIIIKLCASLVTLGSFHQELLSPSKIAYIPSTCSGMAKTSTTSNHEPGTFLPRLRFYFAATSGS
jgi:hypothetical protein